MFEKLRVIELASVLAGPAVGQFFAELGAEVIKVENPASGGDVTRSWLSKGEQPKGTVSAYFSAVNWGKKSVLLNLKNETDRQQLYRLVATADLVIASYKPGDAEKLGVDYESLSAINPKLIYGHITGYGPDDQRVGYDAVIQAESGFMSMNGEAERGPTKMPVALIDVLAAHHLKEGLLLALIKRMSTGEGAYVPVSLLDAAVSSLANQATNWLVGESVPGRKGNAHPNIAPYGEVYMTADAKEIILAVGSDKQFASLCQVLGIVPGDEFATNAKRVENREGLVSLITEAIAKEHAESLLSALIEAKVPAGMVKSIDQVFENGNTDWLLGDETIKGVRNMMALPRGWEKRDLTPPPQLGAHTKEVLKGAAGSQ